MEDNEYGFSTLEDLKQLAAIEKSSNFLPTKI